MNFDLIDDVNNPSPAPPRVRLKLPAIVLGALSDIGLTYVLSTLVAIAVIMSVVHRERINDPGEMVEELQEIFKSPLTVTCMVILGAMCTVMGGYISASLARRDHVQHAFATGLLVLVYGLVMDFISFQNPQQVQAVQKDPEWFQALCHLMAIPAAMLGGWIRKPRTKPDSETPENAEDVLL